MVTAKSTPIQLDLLTLISIAIVAFLLKNILHEAVGHGGACLLVGGRPVSLSTAHFECDEQNVSDAGGRFISAAGTLVNFAAALVFWLAFTYLPRQSDAVRYFLWLSMVGNFLVGAGYPLFSGISNVGDWAAVVAGWEPAWLWRSLLIAVGLVLYVGVGVTFGLRTIISLIGAHPQERLVRAFRLTLIPYLAGSLAASVGALFNPLGIALFFTSAAASFGGASALGWMSQMLKTKWFPNTSEALVQIERNWVWVGLAAVLLALHVFVLGPAINF